MKLKHIAFVAFIAQLLLLGVTIWDIGQVPAQYRVKSITRLVLTIPVPLFFFYVWKRSKDA